MAAQKVELTPRRVEKLAPATTASGYYVPDIVGNGLSIWVSRTGVKAWRYRFTYAGKTDTLTLGPWPTMRREEAVLQAEFLAREKLAGRNPRLANFRPDTASTLGDVMDLHLSKLSAETQRTCRANYSRLRAVHGQTLVNDISQRLLLDWVEKNYEATPSAGKKLLVNLRTAFGHALNPIVAERANVVLPPNYRNPALGIWKEIRWSKDFVPKSYARNWDADEWTAILKAIDAAKADKTFHKPGLMIVELLLLTGARSGELKKLTWSEVETDDKGRKRIVTDKHKLWGRTGRPRQIRLGTNGADVLARAAQYAKEVEYQGEYVFPQRRDQKNSVREHVDAIDQYMTRLSKLAGTKITAHNFRSAYINHTLDVVGMAHLQEVAENCGHTDSRTTLSFYKRQREEELRDISDRADEAMGERIKLAKGKLDSEDDEE